MASDRNCNKCVYHSSGRCTRWECEETTIEDVKMDAFTEGRIFGLDELVGEMVRTKVFDDNPGAFKQVLDMISKCKYGDRNAG